MDSACASLAKPVLYSLPVFMDHYARTEFSIQTPSSPSLLETQSSDYYSYASSVLVTSFIRMVIRGSE